MISKKTQYAIVAMVYLAKANGNKIVMSTEISKNEKIPQRYLENVLLELKKMGMLGSKAGKTGGYFLIKNPEDVKLSDIIRHFEGGIAMVYCVSEKQYQPCEFCKDESTCKIRGVFMDIRKYTLGVLNKTTLKDLIS
ncbi:MAG TPA: Rrf2 family transcriptional regulator [Bacteroidales bacterium]|nr:Rrf2 family transcriptional regulator [Bacteroidales bacterium]